MAFVGRGRARTPPTDPIAQAIDRGYGAREEPVREYLGASTIGHSCDAFLALSLRGLDEDTLEPNLQRIFKLGHKVEDLVVEDLRRAGFAVYDKDPRTGKQWRFEAYGGLVACHADGLIQVVPGETWLLEVKSVNRSNFNAFKKNGVAVWNPKYLGQMHMLMGMSGYAKTLFITYCKDNSEYHSEIVDFDPIVYSAQQVRISTVLFGDAYRQSRMEDSPLCKACFKRKACWENDPIRMTCKTCTHSKPLQNGVWWCGHKNQACLTTCSDWSRYRPKEKQ